MQTNFNQVPDEPQTMYVLEQPEAGCVPPELVYQFLRDNPPCSGNEQLCEYHLKRISADLWKTISSFLRLNFQNKLDNFIVQILRNMSEETLLLVIEFATCNNVSDAVVISALSQIKTEEFHSFVEIIKKYSLLQKSNIHRNFWYTLVNMPLQYLEQFIQFAIERNYDIKDFKGGFICKNHPPESWPAIDTFLKENKNNYTLLENLEQMSAGEYWNYTSFISAHDINDCKARSILSTISESLRERLWKFVSEHDLDIELFGNVTEEQWPKISNFILENLEHLETLKQAKYKIFNSLINKIMKLSDEHLSKFDAFRRLHDIHDFALILQLIDKTPVQRAYLYDLLNEYNIKTDKLFYFQKLSDDAWPTYINVIKKYCLTNQEQLSLLTCKKMEEWENYAEFIASYNMTDFWPLNTLVTITENHFNFLRAFVQQYDIHDEFIIHGLALIPSVRQWENIYTLAQPLFAEPLLPERRGSVMNKLYQITLQEYRIDRDMPVAYDENERLARIEIVINKIARNEMPVDPKVYTEVLLNLLQIPAERQYGFRPKKNTTRVDVHAQNRDNDTENALQQLMTLSYDKKRINKDYENFKSYLMQFPDEYTRLSAQYVLGMIQSQTNGHGPLSEDKIITAHGLNISGKEFLARCWHYIEFGDFMGITDVTLLKKDRENAKISLVRNIADAYEEHAVVCDPGKLQHIAIGILQGRLKRVHIDKEIPIEDNGVNVSDLKSNNNKTSSILVKNTVAMSLRYFLQQYEPTVSSQSELKVYIEDWLKAERGLSGESYLQYREDFRKELDAYLILSDLPLTTNSVSVAENSLFANESNEQHQASSSYLAKK